MNKNSSIAAQCFLVFLILVALFLLVSRYNIIEKMTNMYESVVIPENCYEYLVSDGSAYYLLTSKRAMDGITNPRKFNLLADANKYLLDNKCQPLELINLVVNKSIEDPTDTYEKKCAYDVAKNRFNLAICSNYADASIGPSDDEKSVDDIVSKLKKLGVEYESQFDNYDIEACMIKRVGEEDPELNKPYGNEKNLAEFSKYFNQLNEVISQDFLYLG